MSYLTLTPSIVTMISNSIGKALAGHASRVGDKDNQKLRAKEKKYDNPLTDMVLLLIAEAKLKESLK